MENIVFNYSPLMPSTILCVGQSHVVILITLEVTVIGYLPIIAVTLDEVLDPVLLFWREWSVTTHVLIIHLGTMEVTGDALTHRGVVFLHHTVVEVGETCSPYNDLPLSFLIISHRLGLQRYDYFKKIPNISASFYSIMPLILHLLPLLPHCYHT